MDLQVFNNEELGQVRVVMKDGEPWFVLKDVCDALELSEPHRVAARLDEDDRTLMTVTDALGRDQQTTTINEPAFMMLFSALTKQRQRNLNAG